MLPVSGRELIMVKAHLAPDVIVHPLFWPHTLHLQPSRLLPSTDKKSTKFAITIYHTPSEAEKILKIVHFGFALF